MLDAEDGPNAQGRVDWTAHGAAWPRLGQGSVVSGGQEGGARGRMAAPRPWERGRRWTGGQCARRRAAVLSGKSGRQRTKETAHTAAGFRLYLPLPRRWAVGTARHPAL